MDGDEASPISEYLIELFTLDIEVAANLSWKAWKNEPQDELLKSSEILQAQRFEVGEELFGASKKALNPMEPSSF